MIKVIAACTALIIALSACSEAERKNSGTKAKVDPDKPKGVPSAVYNKVKTIESEHNSELEKAMKDME